MNYFDERKADVKKHKAIVNALPLMITEADKIIPIVEYSWAGGRILQGDMFLITNAGEMRIHSSLSGKGYLIPKSEIDFETGKCRAIPITIHFYPEKLMELNLIGVGESEALLIAAGEYGEAVSAIGSIGE